MMVIALMMRPWLKMVESMGAEGRVLADDILVTAEGPAHAELFEKAYDSTHEYMQDMGARIAPSKSSRFMPSIYTV